MVGASTIPEISLDLIRRLDVPGPRYTSYPTVPMWREDFDADAYERALALGRTKDEPLSIYVHVPFCREMCSYCGCNVIVTRDQARVERYLEALEKEAKLIAERLGRRSITRLHLGGGTPTFLSESQLERLLRTLESIFHFDRNAERALEINPAVTRTSQLSLLAQFGFNRLSMGVQDFDPNVQAAVGRKQTVDETREMIEFARGVGFSSVNFDLIYGLPRQTVESFRRTLETAASLRPDRIATFAFAFVPKLKPHQRRLAVAEMPGPVERIALLRTAQEMLGIAGYRTIGMDHFALPSDELAKAADALELGRDFQGYTVNRAPETVALGLSGISFVSGAYAQNEKSLNRYCASLEAGTLPVERGIWLTDDDRRRRDLITQLMCNFELALTCKEVDYFAPEIRELGALRDLVEVRSNHVRVTPLGRLFVRNVAMVFDRYLDPQAALFSRTV